MQQEVRGPNATEMQREKEKIIHGSFNDYELITLQKRRSLGTLDEQKESIKKKFSTPKEPSQTQKKIK